MVKHYLAHVFPNGYKAQVVATSREAAVRYKKHLDASLAAAVAEAGADQHVQAGPGPPQGDEDGRRDLQTPKRPAATSKSIQTHHDTRRASRASNWRSAVKQTVCNGDLGILIVNNMLLTGFDAPVEQVMYLDKVVVAHNLLQAIARVNRVGGESKDKGFVVDYVGIGHHLKKAIDTYDEREQKEIIEALSFPDEELRELKDAHAAVMELLQKHGLADMSDHDAFYDVFYDEDLAL